MGSSISEIIIVHAIDVAIDACKLSGEEIIVGKTNNYYFFFFLHTDFNSFCLIVSRHTLPFVIL